MYPEIILRGFVITRGLLYNTFNFDFRQTYNQNNWYLFSIYYLEVIGWIQFTETEIILFLFNLFALKRKNNRSSSLPSKKHQSLLLILLLHDPKHLTIPLAELWDGRMTQAIEGLASKRSSNRVEASNRVVGEHYGLSPTSMIAVG